MSDSEFIWHTKRTRAAQLIAEAEKTQAEIAAEVGITPRQLVRWNEHPLFRARVAAIVEETRAAILTRGIALREKRIEALNERHILMRQVINARAADPDYAHAPGGTTGLLVHQIKQIGIGKTAQIVDEFAVDTGLLKELREHEKQAAIEVGQWTEKQQTEVTGKDGEVFTIRIDGMSRHPDTGD